MLDSVEVLLQVTVPAAITAGALIWQSTQANRREDRRREEDRVERQKDREYQSNEADTVRASALAERWRDQRLEVHADLLDAFDTALKKPYDNAARLVGSLWADIKDYDDFEEGPIQAALARVQLLGSEVAAEAARETLESLRMLFHVVWFHAVQRDLSSDYLVSAEDVEELREFADRTTASLKTYRDAARAELGTA